MPPWYTRNHKELFDSVQKKPLVFPSYVSANARSLIRGFLEKNPLRRLGVRGGRGGAEILGHPFFGNINWQKLYARAISPPCKPKVDTGTEASNFDKRFTSMPLDIPLSSSPTKDCIFTGFSYEAVYPVGMR